MVLSDLHSISSLLTQPAEGPRYIFIFSSYFPSSNDISTTYVGVEVRKVRTVEGDGNG